MFELALLIVFVGAAASAAAIIRRKIPLLLQVPERLIQESFVTRPSTIKRCLDPVAAFFIERKYKDVYYTAAIKLLGALRLWLLKTERLIFGILESVQNQNRRWAQSGKGYLGELKEWKQETRENGGNIPKAVFHPEGPPDIAPKKPRRRKKSSGGIDVPAV